MRVACVEPLSQERIERLARRLLQCVSQRVQRLVQECAAGLVPAPTVLDSWEQEALLALAYASVQSVGGRLAHAGRAEAAFGAQRSHVRADQLDLSWLQEVGRDSEAGRLKLR
eukprot:scaffold148_cov144-Isochrysis_galbana.AAC.4